MDIVIKKRPWVYYPQLETKCACNLVSRRHRIIVLEGVTGALVVLEISLLLFKICFRSMVFVVNSSMGIDHVRLKFSVLLGKTKL